MPINFAGNIRGGGGLIKFITRIEPSMGGLLHWVSADVGVTKDMSNLVSSWADRSGNGTDWGVGVGNVTYVPNAQNGLPVLRTSTATNYMTQSAFLSGTDPAEVFVILRSNKTAGEVNYAWGGFGAESYLLNHYPYGYEIYESFGLPNGERTPGYTVLGSEATNYGIYNVTAVAGTNNYVLRLNGSVIGTWSPSTLFWSSTFYLFAGVFDQSYQFVGDIGEVLIYDHALTNDERTKTQNYLATKWGL